MKTIAFVAALACSTLALHATAFAQDDSSTGDDGSSGDMGDATGGDAGGMGGDATGDGAAMPDAAPAATEGTAEATATKKMKVGAEGAVLVPFGDWSDASSIGIGVMGRFDYMVMPKLSVGAHPGYIYGLSKDQGADISTSTSEFLIDAEVRYYITPEISAFADTGINLLSSKISMGDQSDSQSNTRIPLILGAGYTMPKGLTFSAELVIPNLLLTEDGENTLMGVMANVGYLWPL